MTEIFKGYFVSTDMHLVQPVMRVQESVPEGDGH